MSLMMWQDYVAHEGARGTLKVLRDLESPQLDNKRDILVYLPPSYAVQSDRRYPVIYMHDGQNLFDPTTSFAGEWNVDGMLDAKSEVGLEAIVVGIPNMGHDRLNEYSPFDDAKHGPGRGDAYLDFIIDTVKPLVDADFRTYRERDCTGMVGSSMGGLITLYAFFRRGDVFGFAGVMSPALWYPQHQIFGYLDRVSHAGGRIYVDVGTKEGSKELQDVKKLRDRLVQLGYKHGDDMKFVIDLAGAHNEGSWARRMEKVLPFFLAPSCSISVPASAETNVGSVTGSR